MKYVLILACFAVAAQALEWHEFKSTFGKSYTKQEEDHRKGVYEANLKKIQAHNERYAKGEVSHFLAVNKFADMTNKEFRAQMNGLKRGHRVHSSNKHKVSSVGLPGSVDWRQQGVVTDVKDQGQCGSCWSFSTTGSLEGQYALKNGKLVSLSEQQLVDCSGDYGNDGCDGGLMDQAFQYIQQNGLESESDYPYTAEDGYCAYSESDIVTKVSGFVDVDSGDEDALQDAVANVGPISVAIDASNESFQFYAGGVYNEPACSSEYLDHGVLAVGYGTDENGTDFWLVKNSWGDSWGLSGYIQMSRNSDNQCGIATQASYPTL